MFNVTVVNRKDILKYLVSITITLCLVMFVTRYFSTLEKQEKAKLEIEQKISRIMQTSLLVCLDETIPGIKETNHELNNSDEDQINENDILGNLLKIELAIFKQEQKIAEIQNAASNQVENLEENNQKNEENQIIEISRRYHYASCNRKSISRQLQFRM